MGFVVATQVCFESRRISRTVLNYQDKLETRAGGGVGGLSLMSARYLS